MQLTIPKKHLATKALLLGGLLLLCGCTSDHSGKKETTFVKNLSYTVKAAYPHRPTAFSQGLYYEDGKLYESTGLYGESSVAILDLKSGKTLSEISLDDSLFGEGLTKAGNQLIQLTWKAGKVFRYNSETLELVQTQKIQGEGWGITTFEDELVSSSGSSTLVFRDSETLEAKRELTVTFAGRPLARLNELDTAHGYILANVFESRNLLFINPENGQVAASIDLGPLLERERSKYGMRNPGNVVNGVAFRADNGHLLVTGKRWHTVYEIALDALP